MRLSEVQVHAFLQAITCPVLLVSANEGWPHDPKLSSARVQAVSNIEQVLIEGHHHVHLDNPAGVAAVVTPFLAPLFQAASA